MLFNPFIIMFCASVSFFQHNFAVRYLSGTAMQFRLNLIFNSFVHFELYIILDFAFEIHLTITFKCSFDSFLYFKNNKIYGADVDTRTVAPSQVRKA